MASGDETELPTDVATVRTLYNAGEHTWIGGGGWGDVTELTGKSEFAGRIAFKRFSRRGEDEVEGGVNAQLFYAIAHKELCFLQNCRHPNVVRALTMFVVDSEAFAVLALEKGVPAVPYNRRRTGPPQHWDFSAPRDGAQFLRDMLSALEAVHSQKIVHADVKFANILIHNGPGGSRRFVLCDFSASETFEDGQNLLNKGIVTTYPCAPPEMWAAYPHLEPSADIYMVALTAIELTLQRHLMIDLGRGDMDSVRNICIMNRVIGPLEVVENSMVWDVVQVMERRRRPIRPGIYEILRTNMAERGWSRTLQDFLYTIMVPGDHTARPTATRALELLNKIQAGEEVALREPPRPP